MMPPVAVVLGPAPTMPRERRRQQTQKLCAVGARGAVGPGGSSVRQDRRNEASWRPQGSDRTFRFLENVANHVGMLFFLHEEVLAISHPQRRLRCICDVQENILTQFT